MRRTHVLPALVAALAFSACDSSDVAEHTLHPRLVFVDSVVLEQGDSTFLSRPSAISVDDDGYWVADMDLANLKRYDRQGSYQRTLGRSGRGPGEFSSPFRLASAGPDRLVVLDMGDFSAVGVDTRDGTHSFRHSLGGMFFGTAMHYRGDSVLLGGLSMGPMVDGRWESAVGGLWLDLTSGAVTTAVQAPKGSEDLLPSFEFATAVELRDGVLAMWPPLREARLRHHDGSDVDLQIPARTRPVPPGDLKERIMSRELRPDSAWMLLTIPWATSTLPNGDGALVNLGFTMKPEGEGLRATGGFVSIIRAAADSACVDAPLEFRSEELPVIAFRGDTLFTLDHVVRDADAVVILRSFAIDTEGCEWLPVRRVE